MMHPVRDLVDELRLATRRLARRRAFTLFGGLLCAAATGATLTLFAAAKSVLFDPLAMPGSDRLVAVWCVVARYDVSEYPYSWPNFADTRESLSTFEELVAVRNVGLTLTAAEEPVLVEGARVSRRFLHTLGLPPALGADFADDSPVASALLGHELWRTRFGADPTIVGRAIPIDGTPHTVLGVLPPGLRLPNVGSELLVPFDPVGQEERREYHHLRVFGRVRPDTTLEAAAAELLASSERLAREHPDANRELRARLVPLREQMVAGSRASLRLLLGAVGVVFLIACGNVALLQVAAGLARRPELALRAALGAGGRGLVRMQVAESALLAGASGAVGLGLAALAVRLLRRLDPRVLPRAAEISLDPVAALVAVLAVVVAAALFGAAPAFEALRAGAVLRSRSFGTRGAERLQSAFVGAQVALSLLLVLLATSLGARYAALARVDPGYRLDGIASANVALSGERHATPEQRLRAIEAAVEALEASPGVEAAGAISRLPFTTGNSSLVVVPEGAPADEPGPSANFRWVSPATFRVLGIPVLRGRGFTEDDDAAAPLVVILDQSLAEVLWPGESPLGRRVKLGAFDGLWEIVGVVPPVRVVSIDTEPAHLVWAAAPQNPFPAATLEPRFVVSTRGDASAFAVQVGSTLRRALPGQAVHQVQPLAGHLRRSLLDRRLVLGTALAFAATALLLASVGTYSLVSFRVAQRRREWALRCALGAAPPRLLRTVLRGALAPVCGGLVLGAALACAATWQLQLRGGTAGTPSPAAAVVTLFALAGAAAIASAFPALRAARVDPAPALRGED